MQKSLKENLTVIGVLGKVQRCSVLGDAPIVRIKKKLGRKDISKTGAVCVPSKKDALQFELELPRRAGACSVKLWFSRDFGETRGFDLSLSSDLVTDRFFCEIPVTELPESLANGLYYYHFEISFGSFMLYTCSINNIDFELCEELCDRRSRLLVYDKGFETPDWFKGNVMYHVFVDRFFKGSKSVPVSDTAVMNPDWENGIPQYGEYPGAFVENNVFFGGTLYGVAEKLDYLESLGVGCIYLSPIFKAYSNHKYDTGDYMTVDEMFGGEDALRLLIDEAKKRDIKVILDGVFNHTGDDSLYFNRYERYDSIGAYGNEESPYRDWYTFEDNGKYKSWWGIEVLPKLNLENEDCRNYFLGKDGVLEKYLDMGIGGIRLDVADELPESFLDGLRTVVREKNKDGLIIGEVWENAADKIAYGSRRKYFRGSQLDSVMNYPVKNAVTELIKNGDTEFFHNTVTELYMSYPSQCSDVLMNILGTHDTDRILTVLGGDDSEGYTNEQLSVKRMTSEQRTKAIQMLKTASIVQYTLFGTPSLFYGDEAGLEGYRDPFCRLPYPWHKQDKELLSHYRILGGIRRSEPVFAKGYFEFTEVSDGFVSYKRYDKNNEILVTVNVSKQAVTRELSGNYTDIITGETLKKNVDISPMSARILKKNKGRR
ncbi:MAG: glycoside hydrolase family 13 protein [Ruminococcaceae bacterium]|nr:glycoside hydrolase family 13 protein [Oscillospiraceae bacterium]